MEAISRSVGVVKYWEITADNLSKAGWSWGYVPAIDSNGRTIWIADAHRDVQPEERLTAFLELEAAIRDLPVSRAHALLNATAQARKHTD